MLALERSLPGALVMLIASTACAGMGPSGAPGMPEPVTDSELADVADTESESRGISEITREQGDAGSLGASRLTVQARLLPGDVRCFNGGLHVEVGADANNNGALDADEVREATAKCNPGALTATLASAPTTVQSFGLAAETRP